MAHVELIPEAAKLDVNTAPPEQLMRLMLALGGARRRPRDRGGDRRLATAGRRGLLRFVLSVTTPSFRAPHASFQEIEELLLVKGVTPDIFYGTYVPAAEPTGRGGASAACAAAQRPDGLPFGVRLQRPGGRQHGRSGGAGCRRAGPDADQRAGASGAGLAPLTMQRTGRVHVRTSGAAPPACGVEGNSILTIRATARAAAAQRAAFGFEAHGGGAGEVHAARLRRPDPHAALVRHHVEQLTRHALQNSNFTRDLRKLLAFGSGVGHRDRRRGSGSGGGAGAPVARSRCWAG